jgi:hypothetical protein
MEVDFTSLYQKYQCLDPETRKKLVIELSEGAPSSAVEFGRMLDEFIGKLSVSSHYPEVAAVINIFHQEVYEAKQMIDSIARTLRSEHEYSSLFGASSPDALLIRPFVVYLKTGKWSEELPPLLGDYCSELKEIKKEYDSIDKFSKLFLDRQLQHAGFYSYFDPRGSAILQRFEGIVSGIKANNRNLMPLIVFLAKKQARIL